MTFDATKYLRPIKTRNGMADYLDVKFRLLWLRTDHPEATIETEMIVHLPDEAIFRAKVTLPNGASATGWGSETRADFPAGHIEKAETKSVGRALAALGFGVQFVGDDLDEGDRIVDSPVERRPDPAPGGPPEEAARRVAYADHGTDPTPYRPGAALAAEHAARQRSPAPPDPSLRSRASEGSAPHEEYTIERALAVARDPDEGARRERAARWAINQAGSEDELAEIATALGVALPDGRLYADTLRRKREALAAPSPAGEEQ